MILSVFFYGPNAELPSNAWIFVSDNLNGAQILGRIIRVDHVDKYKKKEDEDEETERQKREARGVCRAFQRGECTRGAGCKFSHDEQVREAFYNHATKYFEFLYILFINLFINMHMLAQLLL